MPGSLPATGSQIEMGRVRRAFTNIAPTGGANISLTGTLNPLISRATGISTSLSAVFGGIYYPFTY
jgi:hypothetical protein